MSVLVAFGVACVLGCSSASPSVNVTESVPSPAGGVKAPSVLYVTDFYLDPASMEEAEKPTQRVGRPGGPLKRIRSGVEGLRGEGPQSKAEELVSVLSETITKELSDAGYHAQRLQNRSGLRAAYFPENVVLPQEGWLVTGWFARVLENQPAVEATVGFGKGAGQVTIEVEVSDLAGDPRSPFLHIGSESGQHKRPGGLVTMNPYAMAAKFVIARGETEKDVKEEGASVARCLIQYIKGEPGQ